MGLGDSPLIAAGVARLTLSLRAPSSLHDGDGADGAGADGDADDDCADGDGDAGDDDGREPMASRHLNNPPLSDSYPTIGRFCVGSGLTNQIIKLLKVVDFAAVLLESRSEIEPPASRS
jgi:hypothetical protein